MPPRGRPGRPRRRQRWFRALGGWAGRRRGLLMGLLAALLAVSTAFGIGVVDRLDSGGFSVRDGEAERAAEQLDESFGVHSADFVVAYRHPAWAVADDGFQAELRAVVSRLRALPAVHDVRAPVPDPRLPPAAAPRFFDATPLRGHDGRIGLVIVTVTGDDEQAKVEHYDEVEAVLRDTTLETQVGGRLPAYATAQEISRKDLLRAELVALPLVFAVLLWLLRSIVSALVPVVIAGVSIATALAVLRGLTEAVHVSLFAMNVITFLGIGLAVDYSLFMVLRFREELRQTGDVDESLRRTTATAGRTVLLSGVAVAASLLGLLWFRIPLLESIAVGGTSITLVTLVVTLVFLPALLGVLGPRVEAWRPWAMAAVETGYRNRWYATARLVMRRPAVVGLVVTGVLLLMASPVRRLQLQPGDASLYPAYTEVRQVADLVDDEEVFATGELQPIDVVVQEGDVEPLAAAIRALPGVERVDVTAPVEGATAGTAEPPTAGASTYLRVVPREPPSDEAARALVDEIRALPAPGQRVLVGGVSAVADEIHDEIASAAPKAVATIAGVTFVVLLLAFGSVVLPLKALVLNALSVAAAYGALVWIFQDGRLESVLRYESPGALEPSVLAVTFAVTFGLSMDYEMFLLSRIREEHEECGDNLRAVSRGLGRTGRLITGAAAVLVAVVIGFVAGEMIFIKELGVGLAVAVIVDATIVRALLVPASMAVLGKYNWWAPGPLARLWARAGIGVSERSGDAEETG